jgi:opacity protein-like surface antigen
MKKLFFAALIAVSVSANAFAQDVNQIDPKAMSDFESVFTGASNVKWMSKENFTKASFTQNEKDLDVFYNLDGEFIATTRQINLDEVPTFAKRIFAKNYSDYTVQEVFKFQANNEEAYYISAENEKENVVLKINSGSVSVFSRTAKNQ